MSTLENPDLSCHCHGHLKNVSLVLINLSLYLYLTLTKLYQSKLGTIKQYLASPSMRCDKFILHSFFVLTCFKRVH